MPSTCAESISERIEQPDGVLGHLDDRRLPLQRAAGTDAAMVVGDHLEVALQLLEEGLAPVQVVPLIPMISSSGGPDAAAFAVELDLADGHNRHRPILSARDHRGRARRPQTR